MALRFAMLSLVSLALAGCSAQSLSPVHGTTAGSHSSRAFSAVTFQWSPAAIKMKDGGPYVQTTLTYTASDTVVVNYDQPCNYQVDYDLHPGPTKHNIETDGYSFYAYSGKSGKPPYHCSVQASLKDAGGHVVATADLAVTITYPKKHGHGG